MPAWAGWLFAGLNAVCTIWALGFMFHHQRCIRRWNEINNLLAEIAVQSFMMRHHGTFVAWSALGSLDIEVTASRRRPEI